MLQEGFIYSENIVDFLEKIKKLNRKAGKLGTEPIHVEVTNETKLEERTREAKVVGPDGKTRLVPVKYTIQFIKVIVTGETPKLNGWSLLATIVHDRDLGNMIMCVPGKVLPKKYRETDGRCDHCKTNRYRKETFVVENSSGETKVVGRTCIADFLGSDKIGKFLWALQWPRLVSDLMNSFYDDDRLGVRVEPSYHLPHVLACAKHAIDKYGYVSVAYARDHYDHLSDNNPVATKDRMWLLLWGNSWEGIAPYEPTKEEYEYADKVIAWAKDNMDASANDFNYNVQKMIAAEVVKNPFMGFAVATIAMYRKATEAPKPDRVRSFSNYVGAVKERRDFELTYKGCYGFNTFYGWATIYWFEDDKGNKIVWMSSTSEDFEDGEVYTCRATVKKHSEYKGTKQTEISRPSWDKKGKK